MKKSILNLGKVLNKKEQKNVNGKGSFNNDIESCYSFDKCIDTCGETPDTPGFETCYTDCLLNFSC